VTENGVTKKKIIPLGKDEAMKAWDGVMYNSDGSRVDDSLLMRVRNPFTEDEASHALYGLFMDDFKLRLQKTAIEDAHGTKVDGSDKIAFKEPKYQRQIDSINDEINNVAKRRENLVSAFISDNFPPNFITEIESKAMEWFQEAKTQMQNGAVKKDNVKKDNVKKDSQTLDESLAPNMPDDSETEFPSLPDNSSPEF
jgi:hypothetical protein